MRHKRIVLPMAAVIAIAGAGAYHVFNQASNGSLESASVQAARGTPTFDATPITVQTSYASFHYPAALTPLTNAAVSPPVLATRNYSYADIESWRLSITIEQLNGTTLASDSSYQLRLSQPTRYTQSNVTYNQKTFVIMTDTEVGGFSKVAYLVHGSEVAEVSLYGNDAQGVGNLQRTFAAVLSSWVWTT